MKLSDAQDYPIENMSLIYSSKTNDVYQAVFQTKRFGTFTRVDGRWRALSSEDTSLENLSIIDILPEDYREVTAMFDAARKAKRYLKYDEVKEFEVGDMVDVPEYNTGVYTVVALPGSAVVLLTDINNGTSIVIPSGNGGLTFNS